ncbi:MAG: hypothetical protein COZ46_08275 [Verrucomicrobia bacterium CG_4_10_14_3_um_filter_43_23]|nr:MAG: hypothetical protein AUJ82_08165 [Verrucomicrobia bacterium CG1_02_43_26]PIP59955.1 MAG: hypothetical protein COX01_00995 [Verrucomicrobia bacterium CG22_combo_CG10-13_8_21_14_all_43_17]PIX57580.1 MAG: hypothetical protein COZ46_08275 [Verrucomicrobia bacterium CG_4_10_14_3_um_filter_43_23]PIY61866.1 MAG: hypothetical protein COY94_03430 [Verrucomicrobia bacterium CG_4_10_14_0_8_um_filter_43_34]PJA44487.1 MAG: hypothetical protein CO175_02895 [Verrucomicrobia bacterium CG_4_9_14_3_um_fi
MRGNNSSKQSGFGLSEMMVSLAVMGVLIALITGFFIENIKASIGSEQKNKVNSNIRKVTAELLNSGRGAQAFVLYKSFESIDRNSIEDRLTEGGSGDLIVFLYEGPRPSAKDEKRGYTKIIGYYRAPSNDEDPSTSGPIYKFEQQYDKPNTDSLESLLPDYDTIMSHTLVLSNAIGLADGRSFFNFRNRGVMMNVQVTQGDSVQVTTNTYNFTITPRG